MSPLANMFSQIRNAQAVGHERVLIPFSQLKYNAALILMECGFIAEVEKKNKKGKRMELPYIDIALKYDNDKGVINNIELVSKPSRRIYSPANELKKVKNGYGISIVSTSKGLLTGEDARKKGVGGEIICNIW